MDCNHCATLKARFPISDVSNISKFNLNNKFQPYGAYGKCTNEVLCSHDCLRASFYSTLRRLETLLS